jgi:hypothetical protein
MAPSFTIQTVIEIQFTLYMISYLLLLHFKQKCAPVEVEKMDEVEPVQTEQNDEMESESWKETPSPSMFYVCGLVSLLGDRVRRYWKMGIHWLTTVRNLLLLPFTPEVSKLIWGVQ